MGVLAVALPALARQSHSPHEASSWGARCGVACSSSTVSFTHEASSWGSRRCTFFAGPFKTNIRNKKGTVSVAIHLHKLDSPGPASGGGWRSRGGRNQDREILELNVHFIPTVQLESEVAFEPAAVVLQLGRGHPVELPAR